MSLSAAVIAELVNAGLSGAALVEACERIECAEQPKRSSAAIRQQRYRDRQAEKASGVTRDVTCVTNVTAKRGFVPPNEETSNPPLIPQNTDTPAPASLAIGLVIEVVRLTASAAIAAAKAAKAAGYHRLPATWEPPEPLPDKLAAKVALWPPGMVDDEADAFRAWAVNAKNENGKGRKLDWDQAWHNWLRGKHDEWQRRQPRFGGQQRIGEGKRTVASLVRGRLANVG